jgi:hypothetical protein
VADLAGERTAPDAARTTAQPAASAVSHLIPRPKLPRHCRWRESIARYGINHANAMAQSSHELGADCGESVRQCPQAQRPLEARDLRLGCSRDMAAARLPQMDHRGRAAKCGGSTVVGKVEAKPGPPPAFMAWEVRSA